MDDDDKSFTIIGTGLDVSHSQGRIVAAGIFLLKMFVASMYLEIEHDKTIYTCSEHTYIHVIKYIHHHHVKQGE